MLNHIVIMGRLTRDPELRRTGTGTAVASFTVAVDRDFGKNENGEKEIVGNLEGYSKDSVTVSGREIKLSETAYVKLNDDAGLFDE